MESVHLCARNHCATLARNLHDMKRNASTQYSCFTRARTEHPAYKMSCKSTKTCGRCWGGTTFLISVRAPVSPAAETLEERL